MEKIGSDPEKQIAQTEAQNEKNRYGKFDSSEALLLAYNALESEFTKRCQLVKQLQAELAESSAQASAARSEDGAKDDTVDVTAEEYPLAEAKTSIAPSEPDMRETDVLGEVVRNVADYAEALSAVPEIMDACIAQYKKRLMDADRVRGVLSPAGMAVIMPAARPRTLSDAKRLADKLLR